MKRVPRKIINRRRMCRCAGWWFPHRQGSVSADRTYGCSGPNKSAKRGGLDVGRF